MTKVAKNIKQFRKQNGITQEALAEQMNVTRQAISNWENNKTQPDIDSLEKLSEIFGVRIEELIYGKNKFIEDENDKTRQKNFMKIFLSVFGSLFISIGVVLLFFFFWVDFPLPVKTAFSLLPMILGQAFAVFTYIKKKEKSVWNESAALIWCIGVISTLALINGVYNIDYGYENYLIIDALLCLPVIYIFNAVTPLAPYFYMVIHWSLYSKNIILGIIMLSLGGLFILYNKAKLNESKVKFAIWITVISALTYIVLSIYSIADIHLPILYTMLIALFVLSKKQADFSLPFYTLGLFGTFIFLIIFSWHSVVLQYFSYYGKINIPFVLTMLFALAVIGICIFISRKSYENTPIKIIITAFMLLHIILIFIYLFIYDTGFIQTFGYAYNSTLFSISDIIDFIAEAIENIGLLIPATAIGICYIINGVKSIKLLECNLGIILLFSIIVQITYHFTSILSLSAVFIAFGLILITANTRLSKKKKKEKIEISEGNKEVTENE